MGSNWRQNIPDPPKDERFYVKGAAQMHFDMDQIGQQLSVQTYKLQYWKV